MKSFIFAKRNLKEIIRDITNLVFLIGLPLFLLFIFQQFDIPSEIYSLDNFAPAIVTFGFCFITLFIAQLVAKDRTSSFLTRLFISPMKPFNFILGYSLCTIPIVLAQSIVFFLVAVLLGLTPTINILYTILLSLPISLLFVGLGILIGCSVNDKSAPAVSSIVLQLVCFTSGMWFDTSMVGSFFGTLCKILPFKYALDVVRNSLNGNYSEIIIPLIVTLVISIIVYILSILLFKNKMNNDKL